MTMTLQEYFNFLRAVGASLQQRGISFTSMPDEPYLTVPGNPGGFDILVSLDAHGEIAQVEFWGSYQETSGLMRPMKLTVYKDGKKFMEAEVTDVD